AGLELAYSVNGGAEQRVALTDSAPRRPTPEVRAAHTLFLEEMGLKPGDLVAYHATAKDGAGNTGSSDIYFLEVRPFGRDYKQADAAGGGGGGADNPDGLSARQREIVAGTFNWLRGSAAVAAAVTRRAPKTSPTSSSSRPTSSRTSTSRSAGARSRAPGRSSTRRWSGSAGWRVASSRRTSGCSGWRRR